MKHYTARRYSPAQLDAMREGRAAAHRALPDRPDPPQRQPGRLLLEVNGQTIDLHFVPDPRDVRRWCAWRNGEPYLRGGLEAIWRRIQSELHPALGRRHLD